jgi:hypothetical protein
MDRKNRQKGKRQTESRLVGQEETNREQAGWTGRIGRRVRDKQRAGLLDRKNRQEGKRQTEGRLDGHCTRRMGRRGKWKGTEDRARCVELVQT